MKTNQRLRRNLHLLPSSHPIHASADAATASCPDRSPFPATQKSSEDGSNRSSTAGLNRCVLPPSGTVFGKCIRHHIHRMVHRIDPSQLDP